jgi:uncharacterized damage-inducible protein DinB
MQTVNEETILSQDSAMRRPAAGECDAYYLRYIDQVPEGNVLHLLEQQMESTCRLLAGLDAAQQSYRYAPGKWTVKGVLGHVLDTEWVFLNRILRIARADATPLPGMEPDDFGAAANHDQRSMESLLQELRHLRLAGLALCSSFDDTILSRVGTASGYAFTVRSMIFIVAGHERHHVEVLRQKYLV